jgi:hypothetical protein
LLPPPPSIGEGITPTTDQPGTPATKSHTGDRRLPGGLVPDDAPLPDRFASRLELRLDQGDEPCAGDGELERERQRQGQADEAHIGDDGLDRLLDQARVEAPRVGAFERHHAGVGAKARVKLAVADVNCIDSGRAAGEQDIAEASGRGAEVERHPPPRVEAEGVERRGELQPAARDARRGACADRYDRVGRDQRPRLRCHLAANIHAAAPHHVGGLSARGRQATLHQEMIEPFFL